MPRILGMLFAVCALGLLASACGGDDDDTPATATRDAAAAATSTRTRTAEPTEATTTSAATASATTGAGGSATAGPTSPPPAPFEPFAARRQDGQRQDDQCGAFTVVREGSDLAPGVRQDRVTILDASGKQVLEISGFDPVSNVGVDWCYDVNRNGTPELSVYSFSGGAHCCILQTIFSFDTGAPVSMFQFDAGNAGGMVPREIDGQAPIELLGLDDRLAYFDNLPYAVSPVVPLVYAFRNEDWVEATRDFPPVLNQHRRQLLAELRTTCTPESGYQSDCEKGFTLGIMADSLMIGDWDTFRNELSLQPETWEWLTENEAVVVELFSKPRQ